MLPPPESPNYLATLEELIHLELAFAWKAWQAAPAGAGRRPPTSEDYLIRFPLLNRPDVLGRLLQQERLVRQRCGDDARRRRISNALPK